VKTSFKSTPKSKWSKVKAKLRNEK